MQTSIPQSWSNARHSLPLALLVGAEQLPQIVQRVEALQGVRPDPLLVALRCLENLLGITPSCLICAGGA